LALSLLLLAPPLAVIKLDIMSLLLSLLFALL
jgi:hypothetical protein